MLDENSSVPGKVVASTDGASVCPAGLMPCAGKRRSSHDVTRSVLLFGLMKPLTRPDESVE